MIRVVLFVLLIICSNYASAQDTIPDSIPVHSYKKAMLFSAVVPGAGQVYNHIAMPKGKKKAFWKVPLIYAGLGITGYFAYTNNQLKNGLRSEYENRINGSAPANYLEYDNSGLLSLYATARTRRDFAMIGIGLVYVLNILDAGVEAHFVNFDVSDDLSIHLRPTMYNTNTLGFRATFKFH